MAAVAVPVQSRSAFRSRNVGTALAAAVLGFLFIEYAIGRGGGPLWAIGFSPNSTLLFAYIVGAILYLSVLGFFDHPVRWILGGGTPQQRANYDYGVGGGVERYFRLTLDHKVIGVQYLVTVLLFFC